MGRCTPAGSAAPAPGRTRAAPAPPARRARLASTSTGAGQGRGDAWGAITRALGFWAWPGILKPRCLKGKMSTERHSKPVGLGDIMQVPGKADLMLNAEVVFTNKYEEFWDGTYQLDLIVDIPNFQSQFYTSSSDKKTTKSPMKIHKVTALKNTGGFLFHAAINGTEYIIKCSPKEIINASDAFFRTNRVMSAIENEVINYKIIADLPDLREDFLKMFAHGHLLELAGMGNEVVQRQWDCMILEKGSEVNLADWVHHVRQHVGPDNADYPTALKMMQKLTRQCFKMLQKMHKNHLVHGDCKINQFIWKNEQERGTEKLILLDLERGFYLNSQYTDPLTKNLRMLMDINYLLIFNPFTAFSYDFVNLVHYDMQFIRTHLNSDAFEMKQFILPDQMMFNNSASLAVDKHSSESICKKYYKKENFQFLQDLDVEGFMQFLLSNENLQSLIMQIAALSRQSIIQKREKSDLILPQDIVYPAFSNTKLNFKPKMLDPNFVAPEKFVDYVRQETARAQQGQPSPAIPAAPAPLPIQPFIFKKGLQFNGIQIYTRDMQVVEIEITSFNGTQNAKFLGLGGRDINRLISAWYFHGTHFQEIRVTHLGQIAKLVWKIEGQQHVAFYAVNAMGQIALIKIEDIFS
jgi:hypothetical protein